jgi:Xaa-Pro aminopeptidase
MDYSGRQERAAHAIEESRLDGFTVTHLPNVQYLSGFTGTAGVLVFAAGKWAFFTDGRYSEQAENEVHGARIYVSRGPALLAAANWLARLKPPVVGFEAEHLTVGQLSSWKRSLSYKPRVRETRGIVEQLRTIKEAEEIQLLRKAVKLGSELLPAAIKALKPGAAETSVAAQIEYAARRRGASGMSFETIVAAGKRSALPHGVASSAPIPRKGFVVMDFGVILAHYCSDMTRTVHVGRIPAASRTVYEAVREAQQAAIEAVEPGVAIEKVDGAARRVLKRAGLAKFFTHSTGHGVGLEIHEQPRVAAGVKQELQPGMVITIEPGAYLPGRGGVRIEDMVLVTGNGCEVLTQAEKELIVLD